MQGFFYSRCGLCCKVFFFKCQGKEDMTATNKITELVEGSELVGEDGQA